MLGGWLLRLVLFVLVVTMIVRAVWRLLSGVVDGAMGSGQSPSRGARSVESVPLVRDPVCGTYVVKDKAMSARVGDRTEYFCSTGCRDQFQHQS